MPYGYFSADFNFRIFNIYAPAGRPDRVDFFQSLQVHFVGRIPTIIVGDFNTVKEVSDRVGGSGGGLDSTSILLNNMIYDLGLVDVGKEIGSKQDRFTSCEGGGRFF